jgi:hypothetical protein
VREAQTKTKNLTHPPTTQVTDHRFLLFCPLVGGWGTRYPVPAVLSPIGGRRLVRRGQAPMPLATGNGAGLLRCAAGLHCLAECTGLSSDYLNFKLYDVMCQAARIVSNLAARP